MNKHFKKFVIPGLMAVFLAGFMLSAKNYYGSPSENVPLNDEIKTSDFSENVKNSIKSGFVLTTEKDEIDVDEEILKNWTLEIKRSNNEVQLIPDRNSIISYLKNNLAEEVEIKPQNPLFDVTDGKVYEISPAKPGRNLDIQKTLNNIDQAMTNGENEAEIAFTETHSTLTANALNILGINELIGRGESDFTGSSEARIHNIKVSTALYDGFVVEPDEEFSFNKVLGEVDGSTGYKSELVIKGDKIVPEFGGGICQVSTTMFRVALNSGLPITERKAHSLPVRYYSPQGMDATIYPGIVDLKFKNDTGNYVIINAGFNGNRLIFEIYGASRDREVVVGDPSYYDVQADGALKSVFTRTISYADGREELEQFYSNYQSPSKFENLRNPLE